MGSQNNLPLISIVIPCRNEARFISKSLDSVILQDYPKNKMEIIIIDGMSDDGTTQILKQYQDRYPFIKILNNHKKTTPAALNLGIESAKGEIIVRMDAHNLYERSYISKCVGYLDEYDADNVGGIWINLPSGKSLVSRSIALALSSSFGTGDAYYRIGIKVPTFVDTVPFGCYRKEVFSRIGLFDEDMARTEDDEFNARLIRNGGKVLLAPDVVSFYFTRENLRKLFRAYFQYGYFKPFAAIKIGKVFTARQLIPPLFVASLLLFALLTLFFNPVLYLLVLEFFLYLLLSISFSFKISLKKGFEYLFILPVVFLVLHISYGSGYLGGVIDFILLRKHLKHKIGDVPISR